MARRSRLFAMSVVMRLGGTHTAKTGSAGMLIQPIDYFLLAWFAVALTSTVYVAVDQNRHNPETVVMKWGFIVVTLYMGPIGLLLYVLADKKPRPGEHETFIKPLSLQERCAEIRCFTSPKKPLSGRYCRNAHGEPRRPTFRSRRPIHST